MVTKYKSVHITPDGPGDGRPTALQIIRDEQLEVQWSEKTVLITGCSSGIGVETAKALYETGAQVYATARDLKKASDALGSIVNDERFHLLELDLNSMNSVRGCVENFLKVSNRLNILIANAGIMGTPKDQTADGFETQIGTNHLAHFLLVQLLLPILGKSASSKFRSRVIMVSSAAHRGSTVNLDDLNSETGYDPIQAYAQSKTANIWTSNEIDRLYGSRGVHSLSVHPGGIYTGIMKHISNEQMAEFASDTILAKLMKSPQQGAATTVWASTAKALEGQGGKYLEDCQISEPVQSGAHIFASGYAPWVYDTKNAMKLWDQSLKLVEPWLSE